MPDMGIELGAACMPSGHTFDRGTAPVKQKIVAEVGNASIKTSTKTRHPVTEEKKTGERNSRVVISGTTTK